jgi:toxin FitB
MIYLLDTCIISEFVKPQPQEKVLNFVTSISLHNIFLSAITIGEIWRGIVKLDESRRRNLLEIWFEKDIIEKYSDRILPVTKEIALIWGEKKSELERKGKAISVMDCLISATALYYDFMVVTRNTKDFINTGCKLLNPWED